MGNFNEEKGQVDFGETFLLYYTERFSNTTISKIDDFIEHVEHNGVRGWVGKVSPSDRVPHSYPERNIIIQHARNHKLWHAHLGDPSFKESHHGSYKVSEWVIHFQYFNNYHIKLLELGYHDPMYLPTIDLT